MTNNFHITQLIERAHRINTNQNERGTLSRGQVAELGLLLNRPDWLAEAGFTLVDAIARLTHAEIDAVVVASRHLDNPAFI